MNITIKLYIKKNKPVGACKKPNCVEHKSLYYNELAVFRVSKT